MDDIDRAQIGKRREVAREQINHPKIPKTDLPPMRAINKTGRKQSQERLIALTILVIIILIALAKYLGMF